MSDKEELSAVYAHADRMDDRYMRAVAERDALAAELAEARSERQREHDLRVQFAGHIEALEAALRGARDTLREIEPMVDHVYSLNRIRISEKECVAALAPVETPVSTLCAVCDQIKELHPNTHPWTAKTQSETKGDENGKEA